MHNEPDVIRDQMAETRVSLTDKIETLESTIKDTISTATNVVENVTETVEETVDTVKESVQATTEAVKETVADSVEAVGRLFDVRAHVQRRPWASLAGAVAVGFLGGRLLGAGQPRRPQRTYAETEASAAKFTPTPSRSRQRPHSGNGHGAGRKESWLSQLSQTFGAELSSLKGLALGATFGLLRDMLAQSAPGSIRTQLTSLINSVTTKMGGQPLREPVIEPGQHEEHTQRGVSDEERHQTEMGGSVGTTDRPGKGTVGRSDRRRSNGR